MIRPRNPGLAFERGVPRHWLAGLAFATHVANGVNLLFPAGERFFVRSVYHFLDEIDDPELREKIRGFAGQEGRHANAHERFFQVMREQGFAIDRFLAIYERLAYGFLEKRLPPAVNLAGTAAAEHFTAILADGALREGILDGADPLMRTFLLWHAAEEIEHKAVAFDVLAKVAPSYATRMAGLVLATVTLAGFWAAATVMLLRQDGVTLADLRRELRAMGTERGAGALLRVFTRGIREYVRPGFHPSDNDNYHLARRFLESAGLEAAAA